MWGTQLLALVNYSQNPGLAHELSLLIQDNGQNSLFHLGISISCRLSFALVIELGAQGGTVYFGVSGQDTGDDLFQKLPLFVIFLPSPTLS